METLSEMAMTIEARARKILSEMNAICNCGGPQYGTAHAPDCEFELAADEAWREAQDEAQDEGETDAA